MNQDQMKSLLQRDKLFLKSLYKSDSVSKSRRILSFATDAEINTLLKCLHYISNGEIPIKKEHFARLEKRHISLIRQKLESKSMCQKTLQKARKEKLQFLFKLSKTYPFLLTPLFVE